MRKRNSDLNCRKSKFSFRELLLRKGAFADFLAQHLGEVQDDEDLMELRDAIPDKEVKQIIERSISTVSAGSAERS